VQHEIGRECDLEDEEYLLVGEVAKLGEAVGDAFGEDGALLVEAAELLVGAVREVVDAHYCLLLCP
jgi:hypothetical protein